MSDNVLQLNEFTSEPVANHLNIAPENLVERRAVDVVHRIMRESGPANSPNLSAHFRDIYIETLEKIQFRYEEYKRFSPGFFAKDETPDFAALSVAVICDEYLPGLIGPAKDKRGQLHLPPKTGIEDGVLVRAHTIWSHAQQLRQFGKIEKSAATGAPPALASETICLATLLVLQDCREVETRLPRLTAEERAVVVGHNFANARKFITGATPLGTTVCDFMKLLEAQITDAIDKRPPCKIEMFVDFLRNATPKQPPAPEEAARTAIAMQEYGADLVARHFNITREEKPLAFAAMAYLQRAVAFGNEIEGASVLRMREHCAEIAISTIEMQYDLMDTYYEDFLDGVPEPMIDALKVAVICRDYVEGINEPIENDDEDAETQYRDDGIDPEVALAACAIVAEAGELLRGEMDEAYYHEAPPEVLLTAHVIAFNDLLHFEDSLDGMPIDKLKGLLEIDFPAIDALLCEKTDIGRELGRTLDMVSEKVIGMIEAYEADKALRYKHMRYVPGGLDTPAAP